MLLPKRSPESRPRRSRLRLSVPRTSQPHAAGPSNRAGLPEAALILLACLLAVLLPAAPVLAAGPVLTATPVLAAGAVWPTSADAANAAGRWPSLAEIPCGAYIVMNRTTGQVLLEKDPDKAMYPASTTKVLTALIALERLDLNKTVTLSPKAVTLTPNASKVGYKAGEVVFVRDLLAGMMLASGNDAANAVGEAVSGSEEAFAPVMNERARKAGALHSNFVNPSGIHHDLHVTTARDLALITVEAMKNPLFRSLVALENASMPATNLHPINGWAIFGNTNRLLAFGDSYLGSPELKAVTGVKTGSTNQAGDNLIAAATTTSGIELVAVLLKAPISTVDSNKFVSMRTLLEEGAKKARQGGPTASTSAGSSATSGPAGTSSTAGTPGSASAGSTTGPAGGTTAPASTSGPGSATTATGPGGVPTTSITQLGGNPAAGGSKDGFGFLEGLRTRLGASPSAFLGASVLIGLLLGLGIGLLLVSLLYRATHRRRLKPAAAYGAVRTGTRTRSGNGKQNGSRHDT